MLKVLDWRAVSYSILIGQNMYICQNFDQLTTLVENGQPLSQRPFLITLLKAGGRTWQKREVANAKIWHVQLKHIALKNIEKQVTICYATPRLSSAHHWWNSNEFFYLVKRRS